MNILRRHLYQALVFGVISSATFAVSAQEASAPLFAGEVATEAAGRPAITKFVKGDPAKALIVFIPGSNHLARIAYGGHKGSRPEDFLAHWVQQSGYNFLAISYPLDVKSGVFPKPQPDFTVRDWGRQAMELARRAIDENQLKGRVIVVGWSMGGKIAQSAYAAAKDQKIDLDFYLSFAATPAIPGVVNPDRKFEMLPSGYASRRKDQANWFSQVQTDSRIAGHEIIPKEIYYNDYIGDGSINVEGYKLRYRDGAFAGDLMEGTQDNGAFALEDFPLVAMILNDSPEDARHNVTDLANWSFYNANTIFNRYIAGNKVKPEALPPEKWRGVIELTRTSPELLSVSVPGNHFFFLGEAGARQTAQAIETLEQKVHAFRDSLSGMVGVTIN
ncbi:hypothetical protein MWN33_14280 [Starkeya koreensis]|uniref:Alpha/beta hydrolase n=1 Tax=Ancylobacter koreensis TaxID=266121 RepID=A0ABT0DPS6_9HYPH|nr:hypothetical protein [Ancylobacter koreensis]MCK0209199.1 hypothetical protein [Ancylobacter koreensis]